MQLVTGARDADDGNWGIARLERQRYMNHAFREARREGVAMKDRRFARPQFPNCQR